MFRYLFLAALSACVLAPASPQAPAAKPRKVAFLVGVGTFRHALENLKGGPENDVKHLAEVLRDGGFEVHTVTGAAATKDEIETKFAAVLKGSGNPRNALGQGDILLVSVSTHGFTFATTDPATRERRDEPFVAGYDAR